MKLKDIFRKKDSSSKSKTNISVKIDKKQLEKITGGISIDTTLSSRGGTGMTKA